MEPVFPAHTPAHTPPSPFPQPPRPVLIFDGQCGFCRMWVSRWMQRTGDAVEYLPSQDPTVAERFPQLPPEMFRKSVVLVEPDGRVSTGARAVFRSLAAGSHRFGPRVTLFLYEKVPGASRLAEGAYALVARHREVFARVTRLLWGKTVQLPTHILTRWFFLRGLGLVYLVAFLSLWVQIPGLAGEKGILPANEFLQTLRESLGNRAFLLAPNLFWLTGAHDTALHTACGAGVLLSLLLLAGVATVPVLLLLWALYLSLSVVSQDFLQFQWDALLLETGFLALFFAPLQFLPRLSREREPSHAVLWLLRWLAFRFMFMSGAVKLLSGDPTWRDLTALTHHYETQPLPTPIGWLAHQAPRDFQRFSTFSMFVIEMGLAVLIFLPRRLRISAAAGFALLQIVILLTGNYGFFNWLTLLLCIPLLDDFVFPRRWRERWTGAAAAVPDTARNSSWSPRLIAPVAAAIFLLTAGRVALQFRPLENLPAPFLKILSWTAPFRSFNNYGLFAVMTTTRPEIIVEGSHDGRHWRLYDFRYKPGPLDRRPAFIAPHMPRLDWQMWFAALGDFSQNPWFLRFCRRLLEGSEPVLALLHTNPFPDTPPRFIRARLFDYRFTDRQRLQSTGHWWQREELGPYIPPLTLENGTLRAVNLP